jgi:hypothetical protein
MAWRMNVLKLHRFGADLIQLHPATRRKIEHSSGQPKSAVSRDLDRETTTAVQPLITAAPVAQGLRTAGLWPGIGRVVGVAHQDRKVQRLAVRLDFHEHLLRVGSGPRDAAARRPVRPRGSISAHTTAVSQ